MRFKRKEYFRKLRRKKMRKALLYGLVMPSALILLGYLTASFIILPVMSGWGRFASDKRSNPEWAGSFR